MVSKTKKIKHMLGDDMKKPKISVIVPVYNTEKFLIKCLDSLVSQTLNDIEIVIVNDGSTDNSRVILDIYAHSYPDKFQVIHKDNGGQASARNMALGLCRGEYIGFLDSDDFVKPEMFEKMYMKAIEHNADYVACGYTDIMYKNDEEIVLQEYVASKPAFQKKDLFFGALVSPFLHIYKREIFEKSSVDFPEGVIYEDTAFYINLIPYLEKIDTIEEALAVRVRRSNSTTTTFRKERVANIFPVIANIIEYYHRNNFYLEFGNELEFFCVKILLCSSMQRVSRVDEYSEAVQLTNQTIEFVKDKFPHYRKNPYFKSGKINMYMKSFNKFTSKLYLFLFRIANKFQRTYT